MSLKTRRYEKNQLQDVDTLVDRNFSPETRRTINQFIDTVNNNKLLIGTVAAAFGGAIFLFGTDSGKRVRDEIQTRATDLYNSASDQLSNGFTQVRNYVNDVLSEKQVEDIGILDRDVA